MSKILGLDLGTNSIGWAIVDDKENKIINTGVRIFPEGVEPDTIGKGDKEQSKNAARREARQMRRQNFRTRIRRIKLLETLMKLQMCPLSVEELNIWKKYDKSKGKCSRHFPQSTVFVEWLKQNPYELRARALKENLTLEELGRIFYHLIQRRGFLSNRKSKDDNKIYKGKDNITGITKTKEQIQNSTLGNFLYSIYPEENKPYKTIKDENGKELRVRARYTLRKMYIDEFNKIWNKQAAHLGLNNQKIKIKKIRFYSGTINSKRNQAKINSLQNKFGNDNVIIDETSRKITTIEEIDLKEFFGGEIKEENNELKYRSQESLLFYQRPLRSQKGLLSKCTLEKRKFYDKKNKKWITVGPTPCPISHPQFEIFRAYQFINNIEYGAKQKLDSEQRKIVLNLINKKDSNFDFVNIPKALKLTNEHFNYDNKLKVPGNYTISKLKKLFKPDIWNKCKNEIWQCWYFFEDNDLLIKKLEKNFGLKKADFGKIEKIRLKDGYSNISLKAINNILPFLEKGYRFSDAVILGGVRNSFRKTIDGKQIDRWDDFNNTHNKIEDDIIKIIRERDSKEGEAIEKIKNYLSNPKNNLGFEKNDKCFKKLYHHSQEIEQHEIKDELSEIENLRNPIVQQGINELRRLVNFLLKHYRKDNPEFKFDEIKVELARDLRAGKKSRHEMSFKINENNKKNEEAREKLTEYGLQHSRENIHKYLLYKEIEEKNGTVICPYTGKTIGLNDLLGNENKFQIEHIIPKSISLNDSFSNKTLCEAKFNGLKGNQTPYQFFLNNNSASLWGTNSWDTIEERAFKLLPYHKAKRFTSKTDELDADGFIERQLNDTRYISKKAKEILSEICDKVRVMPGSLTSELRHLWGLNNVLQPVKVFDFENADINENESKPHYLIVDKNENPINILPVYNEKPQINNNETTVAGNFKKNDAKLINLFDNSISNDDKKYWAKIKLNENIIVGEIKNNYFLSAQFTNNNETSNISDGKYWTKIDLDNSPIKINKIYTEKPKSSENQIVLRGKVEKNKFKHDSFSKGIAVNQKDDFYWAIIDIDFDSISCLKVRNEFPLIDENQILITGSINEEGLFSSDIDTAHTFQTDLLPGKYYALFNVRNISNDFTLIKNNEPILENGQKLVEGNVWIDRQTGEIKFDPKKNRDDHRHHAIDAITIALTKQSYLQKLSNYNANKEEKKRGNKYEKPHFEPPWDNLFNDVKNAASKIIVSYKQNNKVLTKINKKIFKNGKKFNSVGFAARGQLHEATIYGQNRHCEKGEFVHRISIKKLKFAKTKGQATYLSDIIDTNIYKTIIERIVKNLSEQEKLILNEILQKENELNKLNTKSSKEKKEK
ncbi:MAG: type II CRISPR RNA-guided endonuclease Cas9, partial [Bacteroidetes bacterium]